MDDLPLTPRPVSLRRVSTAIALVAILGTCVQCLPIPPPDWCMTFNFRRHRAGFEQIVAMTKTEKSGVYTIAMEWTHPSWGLLSSSFTRARWDEYRALLSTTGVKRIDFQGNEDAVAFHYWGWGLAVSGVGKGYLYSPKTPDRVVDADRIPGRR